MSPHPALEDGEGRRIRATRVAPITFLLREDAAWLIRSAGRQAEDLESLSHAARDVLAALEAERALFFGDLARAANRLPSEMEDALWELVAAGLVTADGFENLRALIDPKRRVAKVAASDAAAAFGRTMGAVPRDAETLFRSGREMGGAVAGPLGCAASGLAGSRGRRAAHGEICCLYCEGWKLGGRFAEDDLSRIYGRAVCAAGSARFTAGGAACGDLRTGSSSERGSAESDRNHSSRGSGESAQRYRSRHLLRTDHPRYRWEHHAYQA